MKKITLALSLLAFNNSSISEQTNTQEKSLSPESEVRYLTLEQSLPLADQLYVLLQRKNTLEKQLAEERKKLREKNVLTAADTIGRALATGIVTTPALALYYSKKYIKPEYHSTINKISFVLGAPFVAESTWGLTKKTAHSIYDFFMYEKEQGPIKSVIEKMEKEKNHVQNMIMDIKKQLIPSTDFNYFKNPIIYRFVEFYQKNNLSLDKNKVTIFLATYPEVSINDLLYFFHYRKIGAIIELSEWENKKTSSWSSGNLAQDIAFGVLMAPWLLLGALTSGISDVKETTLESSIEMDQLNMFNDIIQKLTNIAAEQ